MEKNKNCENLSTVQRSCRIWDMTNCLQVNQHTAEYRHLHTLYIYIHKKTHFSHCEINKSVCLIICVYCFICYKCFQLRLMFILSQYFWTCI